MSLATPASVSPGSPRLTRPGPAPVAARASLLALFPAALVAGTGLGLALLAVSAPPPDVPELPPVAAVDRAAQGVVLAAEGSNGGEQRNWAPLFGTAPSEPEPAPEPEPLPEPEMFDEPEEEMPFDDGGLVLRGVALADDDNEAFAIVEGEDGIDVVRIGDLIAEQFEVIEIMPDGIEVLNLDNDEYHLVEFEADRGGSGDNSGTMAGDDFDDDELVDRFDDVEARDGDSSESIDIYDPRLDARERRREALGGSPELLEDDLEVMPSFGAGAPSFGISR